MKWFKHFSFARTDAKIEKLIMRYGMRGYGLYFYCLEIIAGDVSSEKLTFELEHDSEVIAHRFHDLSKAEVEDMMEFMIEIGLFQFNEVTGRVLGLGLVKQLDNTIAQSVQMREMLASPEFQEKAGLLPRRKAIPETTVEVNARKYSDEFEEFWSYYPKKIGKKKCFHKYDVARKEASHSQIMAGLQASVQQWKKEDRKPQYIPYPETWLNQGRWDDVHEVSTEKPKQFCPECGAEWDGDLCGGCGHMRRE